MNPMQPNTPTYGGAALNLFAETSRADNPNAATYDASKRTKTWADPDAAAKADANGNVAYKALAPVQTDPKNPLWTKFIMPAAEAMSLNLYGIHSYPKAGPLAPSQVTSGGSPIDPKFLCTEAEARAIMQSVAGTGLIQESGNAIFPIVYPASEPRKIWDFMFNGVLVNAGLLLGEMNANGVGAPGHWDLSGAEPNWISDLPSSLPPANPAWPVPQRDLLPNEAIQLTLMGWEIVRTDLIAQGPSSGGGGLTPAQDAALANVQRLSIQIAARYGIS